MSSTTQGIILIKTKNQNNLKSLFSGDNYKNSFAEMGSPDSLDNYEKDYVVCTYLDDEADFSQEYQDLCRKLISTEDVEKVILCELVPDYGVYISQFISPEKSSIWSMDVCDDSVSSLSPSQDTEFMQLFPCGGYDLGKIDSYIKALSKIKEYKPKKAIIKKENPLFDYQKERNSETTIARIRFTPKNIKNRDRTFEIFTQLNESDFEDNSFLEKLVFDPEDLSHFMYYYDNEPDRIDKLHKNIINIISGLKFVVKEKNFIYLGFDLENLLEVYNIHYLTKLLSLIKGVSKTWVKLRKEKNSETEIYEINPVNWNNGELIVRAPLSSDSEWLEFKNGLYPPFWPMNSSKFEVTNEVNYLDEDEDLDRDDPLNQKWNCPFCGEIKRTIKAKQCRHCLKNWHDLSEEVYNSASK